MTGAWRTGKDPHCGWESCHGGSLSSCSPGRIFVVRPCDAADVHLLYLDDAGSVGNVKEDYLVLGGVSVFEAQSHWITRELDRLAESLSPGDPHGVEFHASETYARRSEPWKSLNREEARGAIKSVLDVLAGAYDTARAFACVVHKASFPDRDPMEIAFEDLCSRFDRYLQRLRSDGDRHRGLVILDKSAYETTLQRMSVDFRTLGTQWGVIRHLADTPLFVDSRASRVIQLADHVAYAVFRRYQARDAQYFDRIASKFDAEDGVVHGLAHKELRNAGCMCVACVSRRAGEVRQP